MAKHESAFLTQSILVHGVAGAALIALTVLVAVSFRERFIEGLIADSDPGLSFDPVQAAQREDGLVPAVGYPGRCHGRAS